MRLVTPLVKPVRLPTIPAENAVEPLTIDAAKSEPGMFGIENEGFELPLVEGVDEALLLLDGVE